AAEAGAYRPYGDDAGMIRALAGPAALDLVLMGEERGKFRDDSKLYREVMGLAQGDTVQWDRIDRRLEEAYGLPIEVRNFFLALVARIHSFRIVLQPSGEELKPEIDRRVRQGVVLKRARLLDVAQWSMVGDLLHSLFGLSKPTAGRTVVEQD